MICSRIEKGIVEKTSFSVEVLFSLLDLFAAPHNLYHRVYVSDTVAPFFKNVATYMSNLRDEELRLVKKEKLDSALVSAEKLMRRIYTAKTKGEQFISLKISISLGLLRSEQLERRIQAIRLIADTCKTAKTSQDLYHQSFLPTANDNIIVSGLLQVSQVIDEIFGKRSHIQLIQRSTDILKFFLINSKIAKSDLATIWECCERDEQSKFEIYKVIGDSAQFLPNDLIRFIVKKFTKAPRSSLKDQDIGLISVFAGHSVKAPLKLLKKALGLMWEAITGQIPGISQEAIANTITKFCDFITTPTKVPEVVMKEFLELGYELIDKVYIYEIAF